MISGFARPALLLGLALPLLLLLRALRPSPQTAVALPLDHGRRPHRAWGWLLTGGEVLAPGLLAVAILLAAGPLQLSVPETRRALTNIEFCLDVSGSMTADMGAGGYDGPEGNRRYDVCMRAINAFLDFREGDAFGLTIFGNQVLHWVPLTSDASAFRCAPPFLDPAKLPSWFGGTEIGKALLACEKVLAAREEGDRMVILLSDGYSADLSGGRDEEVAQRLRAAGIVVYAIHVADSAPPAELTTIASRTGGEVFAAGDPAALEHVFARIDAMQPVKLEKVAAEAQDLFGPFARAGLILLGLACLAGFGLRRTPW
ncbi:MAG: vWA domain-containing protein [Planctomycetota bacterium]